MPNISAMRPYHDVYHMRKESTQLTYITEQQDNFVNRIFEDAEHHINISSKARIQTVFLFAD